ncbi:ATPase WRNIP1 [Vitis riparia]|uniref:ATPase WRNIP1 n=1 Tax=Vitis riparia TaxID=96939 RepID=UPI00155A8C23|nr:ATPase WRNIP1 [Vitis riparia]
MEREQLLSMGFPDDLASQALAATGGKSILKATEWILGRNKSDSQTPDENPNSSPSPSPFQPKLDRFFHFQSKPSNPPQIQKQHCDTPSLPSPPSKRLRLEAENSPHQPLSERMRPRTVDDVVGQDHLLSHKSLLRSAIDSNRLPSIILWGPPGTGKTSIAKAIVNSSSQPSSYRFVSLSAVTAGVKDVRDVVEEARKIKVSKNMNSKRTLLFVDEVHRFNKSQQDSFLPVIEDGSIVFIGATTENPSFHLITPLLSRCRVLTLNPLQPSHVASLLNRAVADTGRGLAWSVGGASIEVSDEAIDFLSSHCDGDARVALNALEISAVTAAARVPIKQSVCRVEEEEHGESLVENNGVGSSQVTTVTLVDAKEALQSKHLAYDKAGEEHYNLISALHKSMRGSDADASIYWLARMLEGGEEPLYIARRLVRFASEDVGLADPNALVQAVACYQACHFLGMPECNVNLAQCVAYLALAPKSVSVYRAILAAQEVVRESVGQNEGVPLHLRNAPTKLMKELGYGKGYIYPPDNPFSSTQNYLPPSLQGYKFLN